MFYKKILNRSLITHYGGRGDQTFLSDNVWPYISDHVIAYDSFLCNKPFGKNCRLHPANDTGYFVRFIRPWRMSNSLFIQIEQCVRSNKIIELYTRHTDRFSLLFSFLNIKTNINVKSFLLL